MNNLMGLIGMIRGAQNPMAYLQQQAQSNPAIARALEMVQGKNPQEIMGIAQNLAQQQGADINQLRQQLGMGI